jgi:hypothetical protein
MILPALLSMELEVYLLQYRTVYAQNSGDQAITKNWIKSLAQIWLETRLIDKAVYYSLKSDFKPDARGIQLFEETETQRRSFLSPLAHQQRNRSPLRGTLLIFDSLDDYFTGNPVRPDSHMAKRIPRVSAAARELICGLDKNDYIIFLGSKDRDSWMPAAWRDPSAPGPNVKFWSHGSLLYSAEYDIPDSLEETNSYAYHY